MLAIPYSFVVTILVCLWLLSRGILALRQRKVSWLREVQLLPVLISILVVARFTFFPFSKVDGQVQPLLFDAAQMLPFRINGIPFVYLADYPDPRAALLNFVGNTAMFLPIGVIWPMTFKALNTHRRVLGSGVLFSLCIEILQLPFFDRVTDIDDLILNSLGFAAGYGLYLLVSRIAKGIRRQ